MVEKDDKIVLDDLKTLLAQSSKKALRPIKCGKYIADRIPYSIVLFIPISYCPIKAIPTISNKYDNQLIVSMAITISLFNLF